LGRDAKISFAGMKKIFKKIRKFLLLILFLAVLGIGAYLAWSKDGQTVEISQGDSFPSATPESAFPLSPISGLSCADAARRPVAVMLSGDAVTRPLSGIGEADLVFNMLVTPDGITRLMAVYVCGNPKEIGSVRSARHDYIPLARGLDAIYAHWGGSHFALDKLNKGIMDNIDALRNPYSAFYRKSNIEAPHNGFASMSRLLEAAKKLSYRLEGQLSGYPHLDSIQKAAPSEAKALEIDYAGNFQVKYDYDPASNSYLRWRGGTKEVDKNTGQQIAAKNVVIIRAVSRPLEGQYNDVQVEGEGKATVFRNDEQIDGVWKKNASDQTSKLYFYDNAGQEIKFVPGQIWVEIVDPSQGVRWE